MKNDIYLRPLTLNDGDISFSWRNDQRVWKHTPFNPINGISRSTERLWIEDTLKRDDVLRFAICLQSNHRYVGNVQLTDIKGGAAQFHIFIGSPDDWGKGFGGKATTLLLRHVFTILKMERIYLEVRSANTAARYIYQKSGFTEIKNSGYSITMEITAEKFAVREPRSIIEVLRLSNQKEWHHWINRAQSFDFYHTWSYHKLHENRGDPMLFIYREGTDFIGFPFIKRPIHGVDYFDLTSVYGYAGPISNRLFKEHDAKFSQRFKSAFLEFVKNEKIVTVFSSLNPFMDQPELLNLIGGIQYDGKTVVIDLKLSFFIQRSQYKKRVQNKIQRLRDKGWTVRRGHNEADVKAFVEIYEENMSRLAASSSYHFPADYVTALLEAHEFDARLMLVLDRTGYTICAAIVVITGNVLQAHLLGTRDEFRHDSPAKLLTEELSLISRELGLSYFNLGGGLGFKEDSLFDWKSNFSPLTFTHESWRFVADPEIYAQLTANLQINTKDAINFFPLYRA